MNTPPKGGRTFLRMDNVNRSLGGHTGIPPGRQVNYPVKKRSAKSPGKPHF